MNLKNFLHPKRKENLKFTLSPAFTDDNGEPLQWEMKELSAAEGVQLAKDTEGLTNTERMLKYTAAALVVPDLSSAEIVEAAAEECGGKIKTPEEILTDILTDAELARLYEYYYEHNSIGDFMELKERAKN